MARKEAAVNGFAMLVDRAIDAVLGILLCKVNLVQSAINNKCFGYIIQFSVRM